MVSDVNVLDTMDISNPFGVPPGIDHGFDGMHFNSAHGMTLPCHYQEAHGARQPQRSDSYGPDRGEPASEGPPGRIAWGAGPFNSRMGTAGNGLGMAATAAARTAVRTPSPSPSVWNQEEECYNEADEFGNFQLRQMPPRGLSGLSSAPNLLQKNLSTSMNDSLDSGSCWSIQTGRDSARKKAVTLFGGKTEYFGRTYDSTPTNQVFMEDIVNRGKTERGPQTVQRPPPRPAPDFRQTEAWQRAYASRQRNRRPKQPISERPRVSVPRARARTPQRSGQQHDAMEHLQSSSCFLTMEEASHGPAVGQAHSHEGQFHGGHRHGGNATMAAPEPNPEPNGPLDAVAQASVGPPPCRHPQSGMQERPPGLPSVVGWPWKGRSRKVVEDASVFDAQALAAPCASSWKASPSNAVGSGAPPGPPSCCFPRSRSASPEDADLGLAASYCNSPLRGSADRVISERSPSTHDVPLKEMQRLLGETWRCQQLGDLAVAASHASSVTAANYAVATNPATLPGAMAPPLSPVRFSHSDRTCAPPPICSDFVEVRVPQGDGNESLPEVPWSSCGCSLSGASAASTARPTSCGSSISTPDTSKLMSPEYVFLGRLVATLPGDEAAPPSTCQGPSTPQAVVECNFWQLREALGNSPRATAPEVKPPASCNPLAAPPPLLGATLPRPLSFSRSATSLCTPPPFAAPSFAPQDEDEAEDEEFPPWPHEM